MASVSTATVSLAVTGIAPISSGSISKQITQAGDSDVMAETQDVPTSSTVLTYGGVPAACEGLLVKNLDAANFVSIGFHTPVVAGAETVKLIAGAFAYFPRPSAALYAIADTASVKIQKWAVEL